MALSAHMQEALEAKEQEVQRLAEGQREVSRGLLESPDPRSFFTVPSWAGPLKPQAAKNSLGCCWLPDQGSLSSALGTLPGVR